MIAVDFKVRLKKKWFMVSAESVTGPRKNGFVLNVKGGPEIRY